MNAASVAATIARAGVAVTVTPPRSGQLDIASGRVLGTAPTSRTVQAVGYPDRAPDGRMVTDGTPTRRRRFLLAAVDTAGAALPDPQGWTLTDGAGVSWTLAATDAYDRAGVVLAYEARATA